MLDVYVVIVKQRKGYKRTYGYRNVITMVYFTKIIKL